MMRRGTTLAAGLAALLLLTSCSGPQAAPEKTGGTVRIAVNDWVGYRASAAVLGELLEEKLGYEVKTVELTEAQSWEGLEKGTVDVIVENWGREAEKKTYIEEKKVAVSAGRNGNKGIIGWYVPQWMVEKYPDITDWRNLNKYAHLFRTSKTGDLGQILDGDPSYVTNDEALVRNLGLDYKVVYSGSEDALIKAARRATERREALLMYFYEPQWLFTQLKLVKINLPPYAIGCDADAAKVGCDYPPYLLDKIVSRRFADTGGKAYELVRNFVWTNDQQNAVANDMADNGLSAEQAARKWIEANEIVWKDWVPS
ncbi:ABC transporter substrate-binding protein [Planomonospora sp. ID67723]|uniref:ABC transporter substrate-binding protein n=1 Tax=Planomonospora sp. ID67723 TaxID=2738134 RepID=UPI001E44E6E4|nr:ABC transporter substrate-binding protein [Planomonospora sp. ID67723]